MKHIVKKMASLALTATMFFSLTAFTTNTGDNKAHDICCNDHLVHLDLAASTHECGRYRNWNTGEWQYTDWKFSGIGWDIQYRYRDNSVTCAICGKVFSSSRELQKRDRIGYLWVNDWYGVNV